MFWEPECPRCGGDAMLRSASRGLFDLLLGIFVVPCRCESCEARCYKIRPWAAERRGKLTNA